MPGPVLTLTTDFGLSDHYVGTMKGVVLGICPSARIVDISHQVKPYNIAEGAYLIAQAYPYFPKKSVHVVVVDPGVGTARRPILVEAAGHYFVAPDNGVLAMIYSAVPPKVRAITADRYFRKPVSHTFHGRDIFAPVAAHLAAGVSPLRLGKPIQDYVHPIFTKPVLRDNGNWLGQVLHIDQFGNVVTNFHVTNFGDLILKRFSMTVGTSQVKVLARNYDECAGGELFLVAGSAGYLEISLRQASAAHVIGCEPGTPVDLTLF